MPVRSHSIPPPRKPAEQRIPVRIIQVPQPQQPPAKSEPTITQIKRTFNKFANYLEKNQMQYHKDFPNDSTWEQDLCNIPGRVVNRSAQFGEEQRRALREACRQDPELLRELTRRGENNRREKSPVKFVVEKKKSERKERKPRRRRSRESRDEKRYYKK